jgi:hypothetical protein
MKGLEYRLHLSANPFTFLHPRSLAHIGFPFSIPIEPYSEPTNAKTAPFLRFTVPCVFQVYLFLRLVQLFSQPPLYSLRTPVFTRITVCQDHALVRTPDVVDPIVPFTSARFPRLHHYLIHPIGIQV